MTRPADDRWLKVFAPREAPELRMFCFPYAGGGAAVYRLWAQELPAAVEVVAVQLPGRESRWRDPAFQRMEPLVEELGAALAPRLDRPFVFFGHSMGGAVSFEVTRALREAGRPLPRQLFVSGRPAPRALDKDDPIHALPKDQFVERLRDYAGTPEEVLQNAELMELVEPLLRADFAVCETYEYDASPPPLDIPITVFGGVEDEDVPVEKLEPWREETAAEFRLHMLDGGHFFLHENRSELLGLVARELEERHLGAALAGRSGG